MEILADADNRGGNFVYSACSGNNLGGQAHDSDWPLLSSALSKVEGRLSPLSMKFFGQVRNGKSVEGSECKEDDFSVIRPVRTPK